MGRRAIVLLTALALELVACRSAGPYGYAPAYVTTSDEVAATKDAREYDPIMYQRELESWRASKSVLFGVVTARTPGPGGTAYLTVSVRRLEPRNLCANANDEDTCRVTVSDRDFGVVHAQVKLAFGDEIGERSVAAGSLVRLVGSFGADVDPKDGAPILRASFYRHWPRHYFATKANAETLRQ